MSEHHHDHDHDHEHDDRPGPHGAPLSDVQLRVRALESLLVDKGLVDPKALDTLIDTYETKVGPRNGARVVAKAWLDPAFKQRLLADSTAAIAELGYIGRQGEDMVVLENTPKVHNVVVCTLCSCYPWPVLGLPPVWYKSGPYRARTVIDPRGVLREFGVDLVELDKLAAAPVCAIRFRRSWRTLASPRSCEWRWSATHRATRTSVTRTTSWRCFVTRLRCCRELRRRDDEGGEKTAGRRVEGRSQSAAQNRIRDRA